MPPVFGISFAACCSFGVSFGGGGFAAGAGFGGEETGRAAGGAIATTRSDVSISSPLSIDGGGSALARSGSTSSRPAPASSSSTRACARGRVFGSSVEVRRRRHRVGRNQRRHRRDRHRRDRRDRHLGDHRHARGGGNDGRREVRARRRTRRQHRGSLDVVDLERVLARRHLGLRRRHRLPQLDGRRRRGRLPNLRTHFT